MARRHFAFAILTTMLLLPACGTKKFVRTEVGNVDTKVETLSGTIEETQERTRRNEQRIGEMDAKTAQAANEVQQLRRQVEELQAQLKAGPPPPPPPPPPGPPRDQVDAGSKTVQVFYATDRARARGPGVFQNTRAMGGALTLGRIDVNIPERRHRIGDIERPSWWTIHKDDRNEFFVILNRTSDRPDDFYGHLSQRVAGSGEAFVFVHGYNVEFDDAVFRAAQIAHDLSFTGAPIVYSWPSRGTFLGYPHDATTSQQSVAQLKAFLLNVARRTPATTIHLIAHSMGNLPLTRAVADLAGSPEGAKFRHLILAAPDIDAVIFKEQIAPHLAQTGRRVTLYANSKDNALLASKVFNGAIRAGDSTDVLVLPGIDTIDASNVVTDFLGHSTFVPSVLRDIFDLLRDGRPPGARFAMEPVPSTNPSFWMFRPVSR